MIPDSTILQLRDLATEYRTFLELSGDLTPQMRGQRFNGLLAQMFRAWGHRATADLNSHGNIDVAFAIDRERFVLEAKWESHPIATGPIAKLQKRVSQRLGGTIGVFVSMSGYTEEALADVKDGQRLEVVLLDRSHVEAMLTGFSPPDELLRLVLDRAHFYGDATCTLADLLAVDEPPPTLRIGPPTSSYDQSRLVKTSAEGVEVGWAVRDIPFGQGRVSVLPRSRLLVVGGDGILLIDELSRKVERIRSPHGATDAKMLSSEEIAVVRNGAVAILRQGSLFPIGGPFPGGVTFVKDTGAEIIVFANGTQGLGGRYHPRILGPSLTTLSGTLGDEESVPLDVPPGSAGGAVRIRDGLVALLGQSTTVFADGDEVASIRLPVANAFAGTAVDEDGQLLCVGGDTTVFALNVEELEPSAKIVCELNLRGSAFDVALQPGSATVGYVFAHDHAGDGELRGVIARFDMDAQQADLELDEDDSP
jgi:hypothetical protein